MSHVSSSHQVVFGVLTAPQSSWGSLSLLLFLDIFDMKVGFSLVLF
jgi:hypothetical protein